MTFTLNGLYNRYNTQDMKELGATVLIKTLDEDGFDLDSSLAKIGQDVSLIPKLNPNPQGKFLSI